MFGPLEIAVAGLVLTLATGAAVQGRKHRQIVEARTRRRSNRLRLIGQPHWRA